MVMVMAIVMVIIMIMKIQMIDIHNHLLPSVDDGSKDLETSKKILEKCNEQGISTIFATPHINSSVTKSSRNQQLKIFTKIKKLALNYGINLLFGAEIYIPFRLPDLMYGDLVLGESNTLLVEFSQYNPTNIIDLTYNLKKRGYEIIIAHIEKYSYLNLEEIYELKSNGIYLQVNATSILNKKNRKVFNLAKNLIKYELIDFIASDTHNVIKRPPQMKKAYDFIKKQFGSKIAENLFVNNQKKLLF